MDTPDRPSADEQGGAKPPEHASAAPVPRHAPLEPDFELREIRRGTKPGSRFVRLTPRHKQPFKRVAEGRYQATERALQPRSRLEKLWLGFKRFVVGPPLSTAQLIEERLNKLKALAVYSSDMLSSSAYATEEILLILILAGTSRFHLSIPISFAIAALVGVVALSYSQVIRGYPGGGGSYAVAKKNLGTLPGLFAGGSLVVDYTLTVAVSTAAGVAAIVSAVPALNEFRVELAVGSVAVLTLANLRGVREAGTYFAIPAYFFILSLTALIVTGFVRLALGQDLSAGTPPHAIVEGGQALTLFLILRAFSSGSTALTGIEAVSNGVPSFKYPEAKNANITLFWMAGILTFFFLGLTVLAHQLHVIPSQTQTVVAQIGEHVFGRTPPFYAVQMGTTLILLLAANTSFAGLPALGSVMAKDRFLPHQFAFRGDRLAFSHGIVLLGLAAAALLVVFGAETHRLIPLYAVGVFTGFTLSQIGMLVHWRGDPSSAARFSRLVNAVGAIATGVVAVIIAATKFADGAWLTIAAIAFLVFLFARIHSHYRHVAEQLAVTTAPSSEPQPPRATQSPGPVVVPVEELDRAVLRRLDYVRSISRNVMAVHVTDERERGEQLRQRWEKVAPNTPLVIIESSYSSFAGAVLAYIDALRSDPDKYLTLVVPERVPAHFWEGLLHNWTSRRLTRAFRHRPNTVVIQVPYHLPA